MDAPVAAALAWIAATSVLAFALAAWDKGRAARGGRRVPERTLLGVALVGGSPGLGAAMLLARHKTRKASFFLPFLAIVAAQAALLVWWISSG